MDIVYVNNQEAAYMGSSSPITISVNIGTRTSGLLKVVFNAYTPNDPVVTGITYAGTSLSKAIDKLHYTGAAYCYTSVWYLVNPTNGTNNLVITFTGYLGSATLWVDASWYDGALQNQSTVLDQVNSAEGTGYDPTLNITPGSDGQLVIGTYVSEINSPLTVGGETEINNYDWGGNCTGVSYIIQTTAQQQTVDWTGGGSNDDWSLCAATFKPAGGGATEESASVQKYLGVNTSSLHKPQDIVTVTRYSGIETTNQTNEREGIVLAGFRGITVAESKVIFESVSLGRSASTSTLESLDISEISTFERLSGISTFESLDISEISTLERLSGVAVSEIINIQEPVLLTRLDNISIFESIEEGPVEESVTLSRFSVVSASGPKVALSRAYKVDINSGFLSGNTFTITGITVPSDATAVIVMIHGCWFSAANNVLDIANFDEDTDDHFSWIVTARDQNQNRPCMEGQFLLYGQNGFPTRGSTNRTFTGSFTANTGYEGEVVLFFISGTVTDVASFLRGSSSGINTLSWTSTDLGDVHTDDLTLIAGANWTGTIDPSPPESGQIDMVVGNYSTTHYAIAYEFGENTPSATSTQYPQYVGYIAFAIKTQPRIVEESISLGRLADISIFESIDVGPVEESAALAHFIGIMTEEQISLQDILGMGGIKGIVEVEQLTINELVTLSRVGNILSDTSFNGEDATTLNRYEGLNEYSNVVVDNATTFPINKAISLLDQVEVENSNNFNRLTDINIIEEVSGIPIEETVTLGKSLSVTERLPELVDESVSLGINRAIPTLSQTNESDSISLQINFAIYEISQINIFDLITFSKILVLISLDQINIVEIVNLLKNKGINISSETIEYDNLTLGKIDNIITTSQTNELDTVSLSKYFGISALEEAQGFINETIILARSADIEVFQEGISHVSESTIIGRINAISESSQYLINDSAVLNKLNEISEISQCQVSDIINLNRLTEINEVSECQVNNDLLLIKIIRITVIDETQGNYSENVIIDRFLSLTIFQEGISHVSEEVNFARLNIISINEQSKLYNNLIFGRLNGITPFYQTQLYNSLVFSKFDGLSVNSQDIINENITANKFNGLNTNSQIIVPELIDLSQLYGLSILDSRYLLENVDLQYSNSLSLIDSPTIFESIGLERINIITIMALLIGYNSINFNQFKSITAEPPSLYVYNDGSHSIGVLFRDKRLEVPFRDKRASVIQRDKRLEVPFRDKRASVRWREKRGG